MAKTAPDSCEDLAYTKQFFSITRSGHARPTAEFGAPAMVWHVSFWPRRHKDPHEFNMRDESSASGLKSGEQIRHEHTKRFSEVTDDFNEFLLHLQRRGCARAPDLRPPFALEEPLDWEPAVLETDAPVEKPFTAFAAEVCGFTLWWPDAARGRAASNPGREHNLLGDAPDARPYPADLRVRVQAEVTEDFSSITFFIDAGKSWDTDPVDAENATARNIPGVRRGEIFRHIDNIRSTCEARLTPEGKALVDLELLPERIRAVPPPRPQGIAGKTDEEIDNQEELCKLRDEWKLETDTWLANEKVAASDLLAAGDYLYKTVWDDFCRDFDFNLCDIAGRTDEVFANFRGLVMPTSGIDDTKTEDGTNAGRVIEAAAAACGTRPFPRFAGEGDGHNSNAIEPNAVVKAFMPFMRRFRSDADWRDWIACGIFDWRAIYITPLGAQSEFRPWDEGDLSTAVPAGNLRERLTVYGLEGEPKSLPACGDYIKDAGDNEPTHARSAPETRWGDRPAPFRYLLLTKHAPHRKQIGRIIERVNTTGTRRLYALKNWTVLHQAGTWLRVYGQQLDDAYLQWIEKTELTRRKHDLQRDEWWKKIASAIDSLTDRGGRGAAKAAVRRCDNNEKDSDGDRAASEERAITILTDTDAQYRPSRNFLKDWISPLPRHRKRRHNRKAWKKIDTFLQALRNAKEERDVALAEHNRKAERALIGITSQLDTLGKAAIGGLSYRVSRSRYYAELYRITVDGMRVSNIETWWSYSQFAKRGMEPALRFIENAGNRLDKLRDRLQSVKQDILQSSISNQTEATRDNTHKLERIQFALKRIATATESAERRAWNMQFVYWILVSILAIVVATGKIYITFS